MSRSRARVRLHSATRSVRSRKQILNPKALNLNSVILGVRHMLERLIGEDVTIQTELADDVHLVMADAGQIEQVLMNLVLNARDAMTDGGTISVSTRNTLVRPGVTELDGESTDVLPGAYVRLAVRDSGVGIPADVRPRIFEPFFSTKEAGRGTGQGLSTVYGIVRQSGGVITVSSSVGNGSAFVVYLPMTAAGQASVPPPPAATPSPDGRETILLVEDENALGALDALFRCWP